MTKLYGWETLFHGTSVVYAPAGLNSPLSGLNRSVEGVDSILLIIINVTLLFFSSINGHVDAGSGVDP